MGLRVIVRGTPVVVAAQSQAIYLRTDQGVTALNLRDGSLLWHYTIGNSDGAAQPQGYVVQIQQGIIYLLFNRNTSLSALRVLDKEILWHTPLTLAG
ncbi:hypothetical protein [Dictyobacter aurantiacus]|uniref:Pyrrolo-quinoline quinone n=1 Tax=Dictyobacter aurantiacus TaxID=1936993 RepID=A0A401ZGC3_9CHLR|nr:hypothetical protein [Dictyobacter aurantiacus]GCE05738.1 hypothetical protein KDAU_30670 [Dictyobacter aurantiacus]